MIVWLSILAFVVASMFFPVALHCAKKYNVVDNPDARKLQKEPVPVLGGVVVLIGIVIPLLIAVRYFAFADLWYILGALIVLCAIGVTDDIRGLSAIVRFLIEMLLVWVLIWHPMSISNGPMIDHLHGLFGRGQVSYFTAIPLSIVAGVGLVNAINLIDGVDGYSSGYGVTNNLIFACIFHIIGNDAMMTFSLITAAAIIPFYLHNVFGRKSKMFMGDGGSLIVGLVLAINVMTLLSSQTHTEVLEQKGVGLVAMVLAIACVPVFDTLRVMFARLFEGRSPFSPDKTHLHHIFIDMGFSHVGTSTIIILSNLLVVLLWYISFRLGCGMTMQCFLVCVMGVILTWGVYYGFRWAEKRQNGVWKCMNRFGRWTHFEAGGVWKKMEIFMDKLAFSHE